MNANGTAAPIQTRYSNDIIEADSVYQGIDSHTAELVAAIEDGQPAPGTPDEDPVERQIDLLAKRRLTALQGETEQKFIKVAAEIKSLALTNLSLNTFKVEWKSRISIAANQANTELKQKKAEESFAENEVNTFKKDHDLDREPILDGAGKMGVLTFLWIIAETLINGSFLFSSAYPGGLAGGVYFAAFVSSLNAFGALVLAKYLRPILTKHNHNSFLKKTGAIVLVTVIVVVIVFVNAYFSMKRSGGLTLSDLFNPMSIVIILVGCIISSIIYIKWSKVSEPMPEYYRLGRKRQQANHERQECLKRNRQSLSLVASDAIDELSGLETEAERIVKESMEQSLLADSINRRFNNDASLTVDFHVQMKSQHRRHMANALNTAPQYAREKVSLDHLSDYFELNISHVHTDIDTLTDNYEKFVLNAGKLEESIHKEKASAIRALERVG